jgi:lantibiotic modifying enzyme
MLPLEKGGRVKEEPSALGRLEKGAHRLTMDGKAVPAHRYLDTIEDGFVTMHRFLNRNLRMRNAFGRKVRLFLPQTGRRIYRPTARYVEMLSRSYGVGTMVDGLYCSLFFQALCRDGATPRDCVAGEVAALEDGDIPFFRGSSSTLRSPLTGRELRRSLLILRERFSNNTH